MLLTTKAEKISEKMIFLREGGWTSTCVSVCLCFFQNCLCGESRRNKSSTFFKVIDSFSRLGAISSSICGLYRTSNTRACKCFVTFRSACSGDESWIYWWWSIYLFVFKVKIFVFCWKFNIIAHLVLELGPKMRKFAWSFVSTLHFRWIRVFCVWNTDCWITVMPSKGVITCFIRYNEMETGKIQLKRGVTLSNKARIQVHRQPNIFTIDRQLIAYCMAKLTQNWI